MIVSELPRDLLCGTQTAQNLTGHLSALVPGPQEPRIQRWVCVGLTADESVFLGQ